VDIADGAFDSHGLTDMRLGIGWLDGLREGRSRRQGKPKSKNEGSHRCFP
jgi:hypothetical protein